MPTGLNTNFSLSATGGFVLSSGQDKAYNRLWMLSNFDKLRVYLPDYNPGFASLIQKPASFLFQFRQIILGRFQRLIQKYCSEIDVLGLDIVFSYKNRNEYGIYTSYKYTNSVTSTANVIFLG